jgi:hypothetical protein
MFYCAMEGSRRDFTVRLFEVDAPVLEGRSGEMVWRRCDTSPPSCANTSLDLNERGASVLEAEVSGHDAGEAEAP